MNNPGMKFDDGKVRMSLVPPVGIRQIATVMTFGAAKYLPNSWQNLDNARERYLDGLMRHVEAYRDGESFDPDTFMHHLAHAGCNLFFLLHFLDSDGLLNEFSDPSVQDKYAEIAAKFAKAREEVLGAAPK